MYPELHLFSSITLKTYPTLGITAAVVAVAVTGISLARKGIPFRHSTLLLSVMAFGFLAGARLFNALTNPTLYPDILMALMDLHWRNFSLMGGIIGGSVSGMLAAHLLKSDLWLLGDAAVMGAAPAIFLAKLGCFGNGCCFGIPTKVPWGIVYPVGSTPASYYMVKDLPSGDIFGLFTHVSLSLHPTQLYEAFGALICLGASVFLTRWFSVRGSLFLLFITGFSFLRLVSWHLRVPPPDWAMGPEFYPVLYGVIIAGALLALFLRNRAPSV